MFEKSEIALLLKKKLDATISSQELLSLSLWAKEHPKHEELLQKIENEDLLMEDILIWFEYKEIREQGIGKQVRQRTFSKIRGIKSIKTSFRKSILYKALGYTAVMMFIFSPIYFLMMRDNEIITYIADLPPGSNKASILFSDGRYIELDNQSDSSLAKEYLDHKNTYLTNTNNTAETIYAELKTPKGGYYNFLLPDGTKVWLNADSKLKYPLRFEESSRTVTLEGEAYFEVESEYIKNNIKRPFFVKTHNQEVKVVGTKFNIMAYKDHGSTITTLLEGGVSVHSNNQQISLISGEQAILDSKNFVKKEADLEQYLAWKNNEFIFFETELKEAMKELSRWYDFEVVYEDDLPITYLYAQIKRNKSLKEVLEIMNKSDLRFKIERSKTTNRVTVLK